jgi:hypothetical protein
MTLLFRIQHAQDRIEGLDSFDWGEDDYAVIDETQVVDEGQIGGPGRRQGDRGR